MFVPRGNPDLLTAVLGLDTGVPIDTGVEGSDVIGVRVHETTGTSVTVLLEPGGAENEVRK